MSRIDKTSPRDRPLAWLFCALLGALTLPAAAAWNAQLDNGSQISVDPDTQRATISSGRAAGRQLWDGVHRLRDGSTVTIRSGVMVPNQHTLAAPAPLPPIQPLEPPAGPVRPPPDTTCQQLVVQNCGLHGECQKRESCCLAQQLRALQRKAYPADRAGYEWAVAQCQQALHDPQNFRSCEASNGVLAAPCHYLAAHVCGGSTRCASSPVCREANQLLQIQHQQVAAGLPPEAGVRQQCLDMLLSHATFPPCR